MRTAHKINNKMICVECEQNIVQRVWVIADETEIDKEPQNGWFLQYYPSGIVAVAGQYTNGKMDGKWTYFHGNGELKNTFHVKNGVMDGPFLEYNESEIEITNGQYKDGKKDGEWTWRYETGELKEIGNYKDDLLHGPYVAYYKNGKIREKGKYSKGKLHGEYDTYFADGKHRAHGTNVNGKARRITVHGNLDELVKELNEYDPSTLLKQIKE